MSNIENPESIAEFRIRMNLSRRELAVMSGLTQSRIWKIEHTNGGFATDGTLADYDVLNAALIAFETANPGGKPKTAKTTKSSSTEGDFTALHAEIAELKQYIKEQTAENVALSMRNEELATGFRNILSAIEEHVVVMKGKKQSTSVLTGIAASMRLFMEAH